MSNLYGKGTVSSIIFLCQEPDSQQVLVSKVVNPGVNIFKCGILYRWSFQREDKPKLLVLAFCITDFIRTTSSNKEFRNHKDDHLFMHSLENILLMLTLCRHWSDHEEVGWTYNLSSKLLRVKGMPLIIILRHQTSHKPKLSWANLNVDNPRHNSNAPKERCKATRWG